MIHKLQSAAELARSVGRRAAERRLALGLRQIDLAERSGVSRPTIARFERTGTANMDHILRIAIALDAEEGFAGLFPLPERRSLDEILAAQTLPKRARSRGGRRRG